MKNRLALLLAISALILLRSAVYSASGPMVVGRDGTILKVHAGKYGELFPEGVDAASEHSVLALDVFSASGMERVLVPTSESRDAENISALYFGKDSGLTYLLWEGLVSGAHPFVNLASFDGSQWSDVIQIAGNVYADKGAARFVIVPESDPIPKSGSSEAPSKRTVIYVTWQEESPSGGSENYFVPIVLEDGKYVGWRHVIKLDDLVSAQDRRLVGGSTMVSVFDPNLQSVSVLQPSSKGNAIVVGFIDNNTGKFVTLEFEMLPLALGALVETVKEQLLAFSETTNSVDALISRIRGTIFLAGSDFHPSVLEYLADQVAGLLAEHSTVASAVAPPVLDKAGIAMVQIGARVRRKGLVDLEPLDIIALGQTPTGGSPYHYLKVSLVVERNAPEVEGHATLFLSRTGDQALVAWTVDSVAFYRETEGEAWRETHQIELREGFDEEVVYRILSERTLNR